MGSLMIVLDTTIVNVALPSIRGDLHFSQTSLAWVVNAYMLTFGGFLLLGGRLGDHFGHRRLFVAGILLFTAASLACGLDREGIPRRGAGDSGTRRRDRVRRVAVADRVAVRRAR
jgi:predicted MFS family arabinose efflux permease